MKILIALFVGLLATQTFAANWDKKLIQCKSGNNAITLKGKASLFDSRNIKLVKNGKTIIDESYDAEEYDYLEHADTDTYPNEYRDIVIYANKVRPKSSDVGADKLFRVSSNTIVYETFSNVPYAAGGETRALIVQMRGTQQFVVFAEETECKITSLN